VPPKAKKPPEDVTLKDIAEVVGKSVAAVSRALNNHDDISEETRTHIKRVARELGYTPNTMARRLQKRTTDTLGFILPVFSPRDSDPYFAELLAGITNEATKHGFDLLVSTCKPGPDEELAYQRLINGHRVDGMIVARPRWQDIRIDLLLDREFSFVVIGPTNSPGNFPIVADDASAGAKAVVEHLVDQGHKKIALVNTPANLIFSTNYFNGFRSALLKANLPLNEEFLTHSDFSQKEGYRAAQLLLSKTEMPTAIVTADDVVALGVMAAAHDQGFEIGQGLAITGYGDILLAEHSHPPLTTVHRPTYALGQQACHLLITHLREGISQNEYVVVKPSLVIRQSSDLALWL
jgi:LacI family transcriptional regulator